VYSVPVKHARSVTIAAAAALLLAGCSRPEPAPSPRADAAPVEIAPPAPAAQGVPGSKLAFRPNVLLLTLDTTRADHLGCYGDRKAGTPTLERAATAGGP